MKLKDYPFKPQATDDDIKSVERWLETNNKYFVAGVTSFCIKGDILEERRNQGCHLAMSQSNARNRTLIGTEWGVGRWNRNYPTSPKGKKAEPFLDWLLNRSFASPFLMGEKTRDPDWVKDVGGIVVSADIPTPFVQNILITTRHGFEIYPHSFELFSELVKLGYSEMVAYLFSVTLYDSGQGSPSDTLKDRLNKLCTVRGSHRAWPVPVEARVLKRLVNLDMGDKFDEKAPTYRNDLNFYGGTLYGRNVDEIANVEITRNGRNIFYEHQFDPEYMALLKKDPAIRAQVFNPFKSESSYETPLGVPTIKQLIEVVLPYFKQKGYLDEYDANNTEGKEDVVDAKAA